MGLFENLRTRKSKAVAARSIPRDDLTILDSDIIFTNDGVADDDVAVDAGNRVLDHFRFHVEERENGRVHRVWRVVKLGLLRYLPQEARQRPGLTDRMRTVLSGLYNQRSAHYDLVEMKAGIFEKQELGVAQIYGAVGVDGDLGEALSNASLGIAAIRGAISNFPQSRLEPLNAEIARWVRGALREFQHAQVVIGQPEPRQGPRGMGREGPGEMGRTGHDEGRNAYAQQQGEMFCRALATQRQDFLSMTLASRLPQPDLSRMLAGVAQEASVPASQQSGAESISTGIAIPFSLSGQLARSVGTAFGKNKSQAVSDGIAESESHAHTEGHASTHGHAVTEGHAHTEGFATTQGSSESHTTSRTEGHAHTEGEAHTKGQAHTEGHASTHGGSSSASTSVTQVPTVTSRTTGGSTSHSEGQAHTESASVSQGGTAGQSHSEAAGSSHSVSAGESHGQSASVSRGVTQGQSQTQSAGVSQGVTQGQSHTESQGQSTGVNASVGVSENAKASLGVPGVGSVGGGVSAHQEVGASHSRNQGQADTQSQSVSSGVSRGQSDTQSQSVSRGAGHTQSQSQSRSQTAGVSQSQSATQSRSQSVGVSQGQADTQSQGVSRSQSHSQSVTPAHTVVQRATSHGSFSSETRSESNTVSESHTKSQSDTESRSTGHSTGHSSFESTTRSVADTYSRSETESWATTHSESDSEAHGQTQSHGVTRAAGHSIGRTLGRSMGRGFGVGLMPSFGLSRSYQWWNDQAVQLTQILRAQEEMLRQATLDGAYLTDVYVLTRHEEGSVAAETALRQAYQGDGDLVITPVQTRHLTDEEQEYIRKHAMAFTQSMREEPIASTLEAYKDATMLLPLQLAAYTAPVLFEEGPTVTMQERIPAFAFLPDMASVLGSKRQGPADAVLAHQWSTERAELTEAPLRLSEDRFFHTVFGADTGFGKSVAAERLVYETTRKWHYRTVVLDFGAGWRRLLKTPGLPQSRVEVHQLFPGATVPFRWNPWQVGKRIQPERQMVATCEIFKNAGRMGARQLGLMRRAARELYLENGVLTADEEVLADGVWGKVRGNAEEEAINAVRRERGLAEEGKTGDAMNDLAPFERQALAVHRSKSVDMSAWVERLASYMPQLEEKGDRATMQSLEGILLRLEPFTQGEMARMYGSGKNTVSVEDLALLGPGGDQWGVSVLEGGAEMDEYIKISILGLVAWHLYNDAVVRRRRDIGKKGGPVLQIVFEEANKVLTGTDAGGDNQQQSGAAATSALFQTMWRDGRKYDIFLHPIVQTVSELPPGILSSCNNAFFGQTKNPDDRDLMMSHLAFSEKGFTDEDYKRFISRMPVAMAIAKLGYTQDIMQTTPFLCRPLMIPAQEPTDHELYEIMQTKGDNGKVETADSW